MQSKRVKTNDGMLANFRYRKKWKRATSVLSIFVVIGTIGSLMLPAITMSQAACGMEEHTHSVECYESSDEHSLSCTLESLGVHAHEESCFDEAGELVCPLPDFVVHTHEEQCRDGEGNLICALEEIREHRHDDTCYQAAVIVTDPGHAHTDACYEMVKSENPTCGQAESGGHQHGDTCYATGEELLCGLEETPGHTHGAGCVGSEQKLTCALEENEEHPHGDACYETVEITLCGQEEIPGHTHTDSCKAQAGSLLCAISESDGHRHSENCYGLIRGQLTCTEMEREAVTGAGEPELVCEREEITLHTHTDPCYGTNANQEQVLTCILPEILEHRHTEACFPEGEDKVIICQIPEHRHTDACAGSTSLPAEEQALVDALIQQIEALPTVEEVNAQMTAFAESGDTAAQESYLTQLTAQTAPVLAQYEALTEDQKLAVTNAAELMALQPLLPESPSALTEEEQAQVDALIKLIDSLPTVEELTAQPATLALDQETTPLQNLNEEVQSARETYNNMTAAQQAAVTNEPKLAALEEQLDLICTCEIETDEHSEGCPLYISAQLANIYILSDAGYSLVENHSESSHINIKDYDGQTLYIPAAEYRQDVYLSYHGFADAGATFVLDNTEYASLAEVDHGWTGTNSNVVRLTIAENTPYNTELTVTAKSVLDREYSVKITMIDPALLKKDAGPDCDCAYSNETMEKHDSVCARKCYIIALIEGKTAQEIYAQWDSYDETLQLDILAVLKEHDVDVYNELKKLAQILDYEEIVVLPNGTTISAADGVKIDAQITDEEKQSVIMSGLNLQASAHSDRTETSIYFMDISADSEKASVLVSGLLEDNNYKHVIVFHMLDTLTAIENAEANGEALYFTTDDQTAFVKEIAVSQEYTQTEENRVYYTLQLADLHSNGDVIFETDSWSTFAFYVIFEYDGLQYGLNGGNEVEIQYILEALDISYNANQVTNVSTSNTDVVTPTYKGGTWWIKASKSFTSVEWMEITFSSGDIIRIRMVDPIIYSYLYDTGEYGNTGTTEGYSHGSYSTNNVVNTVGVLSELINNTNSSSTYMDEVDIFVRPGMSIKLTRWLGGTKNAVENAGLGYAWSDCEDANQDHEDAYHFNMVEIPSGITSYTKYDLEIASYVEITNGSKNYKVTKFHIHVIPENAAPQKMETVLAQNSQLGLEIREIPVTLYNFDGYAYNKTNSVRQFRGNSLGINATGTGVTINASVLNGGANGAGMGHLKEDLDSNGLPVWRFGENVDLFGPSSTNYKTVYQNVGFQFVYDDSEKHYTYSSTLNHAQYNASSNKIELYRESMASNQLASVNGDSGAYTRGGFYPFGDIDKAFLNLPPTVLDTYGETTKESYQKYINSHPATTDLNAWKEALSDETADHRAYLAQMPWTTLDARSKLDMHFGLQVNAKFYMPKGKQITNDEGVAKDLIYEFSGDDDLWVFIDGKLVLDIGGGHTPVYGSINLKTGKVIVERGQEIVDQNTLGTEYAPYEATSEFLLNLKENSMHTLQIFYMESHSGVSNCYMSFNLPLAPSNSVTVSKDVVADDGEELSIMTDEEFKFLLEVSKAGGPFVATTEYPCTLLSDNSLVTADENSIYTIKNGQAIRFTEIPQYEGDATATTQATRVRVVEILGNAPYTITKTEVNGIVIQPEENNRIVSGIETITDTGTISYSFRNFIEAEPLIIEKSVEGKGKPLLDDDQTYTFDLTFSSNSQDPLLAGSVPVLYDKTNADNLSLSENGMLTFDLKDQGTLTLERVPVGLDYDVSERSPQITHVSFDTPYYTLSVGGEIKESQSVVFGNKFSQTMQAGGENRILALNKTVGDYVELPECGGVGSELYMFSGWAMMVVACALMYNKRKNRKGAK